VAEDWRADYQARKAAEEPEAKANLRKALDLLDQFGVLTVYLAHEGEEGAGSIFGVVFEPLPADGIPEAIEDMVRAAAYWLLPAGWEMNAGSFGTLVIDVCKRKARLDHTRRVRFVQENTEEIDL
jgi:hypothetical protein